MTDPRPFPAADYSAWRQRVERELGEAEFGAELTSRLASGIEIQPLYLESDVSARQPRLPSTNAFGWHPCPRYEQPDPATVNAQVLADLAGGASALWLRLDLAARTGVDADDLAAGALAGRDGLAAHHVGDLDVALAGVELDAVQLVIDNGGNALPAAATLLALIEQRGLELGAQELHFNCDPLAALAADGRIPASLDEVKDEMDQLMRFCRSTMPAATAVTVSDLPYNDAGGTAVEELGMAAATLICYLRWLAAEGCAPTEAAPHILLRSAVGRDLFVGIAKLRALRLLWGKIFGACKVSPPPAQIHAVTADRPLARRDPWVNMLRTTGQTVAATLGGADLVTTAAWDRPQGAASDAARRLARNTQSILAEESALGAVFDPAGGSYYLEQLTDDLARGGWQFMREIEAEGGAARVLTSGWLAARLAERRAARGAAIASGEHVVLGVNRHPNDGEQIPQRELADADAAADRAAERMRNHRRSRREAPDGELGGALADGVASSVKMASSGATLREIATGLRRSCCETMPRLPSQRDDEVAP